MSLLLEIVTPDRLVFSEFVEHVVLPSEVGELGILPGHIPLLTAMEPGEIQVIQSSGTDYLAVDKGFIQVMGDKVSVLTEQAIEVSAIDEASLAEATAKANAALEAARDQEDDAAVLEELETAARFAVIQKLVKEKRKS